MAGLTVQTVYILRSHGQEWDPCAGLWGEGAYEDTSYTVGIFDTLFEAVAQGCLISEFREERQEEGTYELSGFEFLDYEIDEEEVRS